MSEQWTIDFGDFDQFMNELSTLYPDVVADEARDTMEKSMWVFHQAVDLETPVGVSGNLRAANAVEMTGTPVELVGMLVNPLPYAWVVERGRMAGRMPPIGPIELWVIRKDLGWTYTTKSGKTVPMTTHQMAFVIARAIGRRGTKGAAMFHKGFRVALPHVERLWEGLPGRVVTRLSK